MLRSWLRDQWKFLAWEQNVQRSHGTGKSRGALKERNEAQLEARRGPRRNRKQPYHEARRGPRRKRKQPAPEPGIRHTGSL